MPDFPLASPFHEKKSCFDGGNARGDEPIRKYFGVSKSSKRSKDEIERPKEGLKEN
jgi:hypothetical protein